MSGVELLNVFFHLVLRLWRRTENTDDLDEMLQVRDLCLKALCERRIILPNLLRQLVYVDFPSVLLEFDDDVFRDRALCSGSAGQIPPAGMGGRLPITSRTVLVLCSG